MRKQMIGLLLLLCVFCSAIPVRAAQESKAPDLELAERFAVLEEAKKQEVYQLAGGVLDAIKALLHQYAEYSLIEESAANGIFTALEGQLEHAKQTGSAPGIFLPRPPKQLGCRVS